MGLKSCGDCGKTSHTDKNHCIYCGSSKFKTTDLLDSAWLIFAIFSVMVAMTFFYGNRVLNELNIGVLSARDFRNCHNDRMIISLRNVFNESDYAVKNKLRATSLEAKIYPYQKDDALIACKVNMHLSDDTDHTYIYQIKYSHGHYIFEHYPLNRLVDPVQ